MFTKEDYVRYFEDLAHVERKMIYMVNDVITRLTDPQLVNSLNRVAADEAKHYSYLLDVLAAHLELNANTERRLSPRSNSFGRVDLAPAGNPEGGTVFQGYCANLSQDGLCLESAKPFRVGEEYSIKISPYDSAGSVLVRKGRVVWAREILDFYIGGIAFET